MFLKRYFLLIALIVFFALVLSVYFLSQGEPPDVFEPEEETFRPMTEEIAKPGEVGEITVKDEETGEEKPLVKPGLPEVISSTVGVVQEVKQDSIIVLGEGTNFADQQPRELTCFFTDKTLIIAQNKEKYKGMEGLSVLQPNMEVLIDGAENIRGETEFKVKALRIIKEF